jgi:hypothetical protein
MNDTDFEKQIRASLTKEEQATLEQFESVLKNDVTAFMRPGEVIYSVTLKEILQFAKLIKES